MDFPHFEWLHLGLVKSTIFDTETAAPRLPLLALLDFAPGKELDFMLDIKCQLKTIYIISIQH